jgi:carbonic anhydrase/acetyltransferase-like protein (isoleucine patch superfamily)
MGSGRGQVRRAVTSHPPVMLHDFAAIQGPVLAHIHVNPDGSRGGWVAETASVDETVYVEHDACVYGHAHVLGNARVHGNARVSGEAYVLGDATVTDNAAVFGKARVSGYACVSGDAIPFRNDCQGLSVDAD